MSVLKKVYPLGQVPQITTQHRELLPQQRQALGSQVHGLRPAANARKVRDVMS